MTLVRPDDLQEVLFVLNDIEYRTDARRGDIVHEAFHNALPVEYTAGHRLTFRSADGTELFADNFVGEIADTFGAVTILAAALPIADTPGPWRTIGFDHLAISVIDRADARDFFQNVVRMKVMRDDAHLTVLATGPTALFLFDAGKDAPLSTGTASSWHHIGFVVDNLEHAYAHLQSHRDRLSSDFALLDRDERWSLYFHYQNGDVRFMIQFSEIKQQERGFTTPEQKEFAHYLYDYASRPYGLQLTAHADKD